MGPSLESRILYEDNHLIAVNKRPSELVQPDRTGDEALNERVKEYIAVAYEKPGNVYLGVVHRIDRPVSGVLLFSRTSKALRRMHEHFRNKTVQKVYWAAVKGPLPRERMELKHHLRKDQRRNQSFVVDPAQKGAKEAVTRYKVIGRGDRYTFLEIQPVTGRHHQIRAQLAHIGCPIKGDVKYGARRANRDASIHLHARSMEFIHPVRQTPCNIRAPLPADGLWDALKGMVGDSHGK